MNNNSVPGAKGTALFPVLLPPAVPNITEDKKRHGGEVKNAPVKGFCRAFAQLLRRAGADRTLRLYGGCAVQGN